MYILIDLLLVDVFNELLAIFKFIGFCNPKSCRNEINFLEMTCDTSCLINALVLFFRLELPVLLLDLELDRDLDLFAVSDCALSLAAVEDPSCTRPSLADSEILIMGFDKEFLRSLPKLLERAPPNELIEGNSKRSEDAEDDDRRLTLDFNLSRLKLRLCMFLYYFTGLDVVWGLILQDDKNTL